MSPLLKILIGAAAGAGIGFLVYRFVGCRTGACPLTGNPYVAMVVWGAIGAMMAAGK